MKILRILALAALLPLLSCGGGDDDDNGGGGGGGGLSSNACGTIGLNARIINGTECESDNSPVVEIDLFTADGRGFLCTGTMITSTDILTAAHCFFQDPSIAFITVNGSRVNAVSFSVHPDVSATPSAIFNDVAILKLERGVDLPTLPLIQSVDVQSGDVIAIFGYGQTEDSSSDSSGKLRSGEMLVSSVSNDHIAAEYDGDGSNTCFGDSGGPAVLTLPDGQVGIVGITSSGALEDCGPGDLSLFANTQKNSILDFITSTVPSVRVK